MRSLKFSFLIVLIIILTSFITAKGQNIEDNNIEYNFTSPQLVLDVGASGEFDSMWVLSSEENIIKDKNFTNTKTEKGFIKFIKNLNLIFEPSFGYSVMDPAICSIYGKDLGTFREHFGYVPVFGYSIKILHNNTGIRLGYFYQRSKPSYFQIDPSYQKWYINYTLEQIYIQIYYNFDIKKRIIITPFLGLLIPKYDIDKIAVEAGTGGEGIMDGFALDNYIDVGGPVLSLQISYKFSSNNSIFLIYNFQKKDNLSFGLSFKIL